MCDETGALLEFKLPLYSPNFNPIEKAFTELKQWLKRNYLLTDTDDNFQGLLVGALTELSQNPGIHFKSRHIPIYSYCSPN